MKKIKKSELIEAKFIVPNEKVKDFDNEMEHQYDEDDVVQVVDENQFLVPDKKVKDFDNEMGKDLDSDDTVQVYDSDKPDEIKSVFTKEGLVKNIRESLKNKLK
jgi:hypothetical protein